MSFSLNGWSISRRVALCFALLLGCMFILSGISLYNLQTVESTENTNSQIFAPATGLAVLQYRLGRRRSPCRSRLARAMGGQLRTRQRHEAARACRAGVDALQAAPGGRSPLAAHCIAVLAGWRLDPRAKRVAAVDAGAQCATARRQTAPAVYRDVRG